ncbi:hypothetical protein GCM10010517_27720 [Streptosporangium fragile]|uniref:Uncharacterized protein n=1 Tax=Streptosporangium fragile TaxID=46186 RepID=A0ABP6IET2_9ACTN
MVAAAPGECRYAWKAEPGAIRDGTWNGALTLADLDLFPTDPDALREYVRGLHDRQVRDGVAAGSFERTQSLVGAWLLQLPARPELQAAVLRMLAELPGTEVLGETADPLGRTGLGVRIGKTDGPLSARVGGDPVSTDWQLILDRRTGRMLALRNTALHDLPDVAKGTLVSYTVFLEQGWTDRRPEVPEGCREDPAIP